MPDQKKKHWFKWMKAYKVERTRKNSIAALSMHPEYSGLDQLSFESTIDAGAGRNRSASDWAQKEAKHDFLDEVVEDVMKFEGNLEKARAVAEKMVSSLGRLAAEGDAKEQSRTDLKMYVQLQTAISVVLASVILYMHSTETTFLVAERSHLSTLVVMVASFALVAAAGGLRAVLGAGSKSGHHAPQKLSSVLDDAKAAVKLLTIGTKEADAASAASDDQDFVQGMLPSDQFGEPCGETFMVRSVSYSKDQKKEKSAHSMCKLLAVDLVETAHNMQNIAAHPKNRVARANARGEKSFTFVLNFMIPGPHFLSYSAYWEVDVSKVNADTPFGRIAKPFFFGDSDEYRDNHFKFIPKVVEGNFAIKMAVKDTPTLMGHKLKQYYHRADHYLEIDIDISSSSIARNITGLVLGYAKSLEIHMAIVLQGDTVEELPEVVLGTCSAMHVDLLSAPMLE